MKYLTLLYYNYVFVADPTKEVENHLAFCESIGLKGRILIASEGLNGTVSGTQEQCEEYMKHIAAHPLFHDTEFKIDEVEAVTFNKMHVRAKKEIVAFGDRDHEIDPSRETAPHLTPEEVLEMKDEDNVVMLDVRSNYEHNIGKFKNAVTLDIDNFRDFPLQIKELEPLKDKTVITYCTGGIKCEKASAFLLKNGFENVYQIDGGIVKYCKETGGKDFDGELYVFDQRVKVPVNSVNPETISICKRCEEKSTRMVNCANPVCNDHFVLCEACGWKHEGTCSDECFDVPKRRKYDGTGYYLRGVNSKVYVEKEEL